MTEHRSGRVYHDDSAWPHLELGPQDDRRYVEQLIIRNHRKISEAVESAAVVNEVVAQYGSFDAYLRSFGSPEEEIADLRHRFPGLGDYSAWWFMQSVGLPTPPTH